MSGKTKQKNNRWLLIVLGAAAVAAVCFLLLRPEQETPPAQEEAQQSGIQIEQVQKAEIALPYDLVLQDIGSYTGLYMEDGSNEVLSDILMIVARNDGEKTVQYAEILMSDDAQTAQFTLTTLPPGESVVLLEQSRMAYDGGREVTEIEVSQIALFPEEPTLCEDKLELQPLNGMLKITNISGGDISGDVVVYYKNSSADMLYGGITYRVTIAGGLKAGESRQVPAGHLSQSGSRIMFATVS